MIIITATEHASINAMVRVKSQFSRGLRENYNPNPSKLSPEQDAHLAEDDYLRQKKPIRTNTMLKIIQCHPYIYVKPLN